MIKKFTTLEPKKFLDRPKAQPLTSTKAEKFLACLAKGDSPAKAARTIGFTRSAIYAARNAIPEFADAWKEALEEGTDMFEDKLVELATQETPWGPAILVLLKTRRPEVYATKLVNPMVMIRTDSAVFASIEQMEREETEKSNVLPFKTEITIEHDQPPNR